MNQLPLLIESTVKASLVMLAAFAAIACFRSRGSAAMRHWILSAAIVAATTAPLLGAVVPSWRVPLDAIPRPQLVARTAPASDGGVVRRSGATAEPAPQTATGVSLARLGTIVATTWATGAGISALILIVGLGRLAWVASSARRVVSGRWTVAAAEIAREYGLRRQVALLQSDHPALLVTWGFVQPKVILPRTAQDWTDARIRVVVPIASIDAGDPYFTENVTQGDWLDAKNNPEAVFEVNQGVFKDSETQYEATGILTLKGQKLPVRLPFKLEINGANAKMHGEVTLQRLDAGIGKGTLAKKPAKGDDEWVDDDIKVIVDVVATRQ